jgi:hypothetical protein
MVTTTVKVQTKTKALLDKVKEKDESYDEIIARMAKAMNRKTREALLIEGYKQQYNVTTFQDWEGADAQWPK